MARIAIFRFAAVFLLLLTGAELFACEMIDPQNCESFGFPQSDGAGSAGDNCICCCTHVVVVTCTPLFPVVERVAGVMPPETSKPEFKSLSIYHPPRA